MVLAGLGVGQAQGVALEISRVSGGVSWPTLNYAPVTMVEVRLDPGALVTQDLVAGYNAFVVVLEGQGQVADQAVRAGDVAFLSRSAEPTEVVLRAAPDARLRVLLYAGRPLREPVVARGPFVMNTEQQIQEAFADYYAGRFAPQSG